LKEWETLIEHVTDQANALEEESVLLASPLRGLQIARRADGGISGGGQAGTAGGAGLGGADLVPRIPSPR